MTIQIRPAMEDDACPACDVLHRSIVACCVDDHRGDALALQAWLRNKTPEQLRRWIISKDHHAVMALVDGRPAGFALSSRAGNVLLCYRVQDVRWTGVGKAMLAAVEHRARADDVTLLRLESTRTARSFYLRNGFVESGPPISAFGMQVYPMEKALVRPVPRTGLS